MSKNKTILVGLSGGVDSSVTAYLLKKEGFNVIGATMSVWDNSIKAPAGGNACLSPDEKEDIEKTKEFAQLIDIPYYVFDCSKEYNQIVLDYFKKTYLSGRTPNPCVRCNQMVKFGVLPDIARKSGIEFDYFATGHYAQVEFNSITKRYNLKKGINLKKDQSYFLYRLSQQQLASLLLPLGIYTKEQVRKIAKDAGLTVHDSEESQDFYCGDYSDLLGVDNTAGDIVMRNGKIVGTHQGIWNYTIGQRKGMGVAYTEPLYVLELDAKNNKVIVGVKEEVMNSSFFVNDLNWMAIEKLTEKMEVHVKIRSAQTGSMAIIEPFDDQSIKVHFHQPVDAITPGQSAVFYDNDIVIGGGVIDKIDK